MTFQMNDQGKRQDLTLQALLQALQAMRKTAVESVRGRFAQAAGTAGYLALLGSDLPMALGSNLRSEFSREGQ